MAKSNKNSLPLREGRGGSEGGVGSGPTLADFVIPDKVDAFVRCYQPVTEPTEMVEVFTDAKLREFFKAWYCPIGDPLTEYLCMLRAQGYIMTVDPATNEPAIVVTPRT